MSSRRLLAERQSPPPRAPCLHPLSAASLSKVMLMQSTAQICHLHAVRAWELL